MNETIFNLAVSHETIYGIRHHPVSDINRKDAAVIFLHGWAGYRTGPHDMLVKLARHLAGIGYDCFRFDFRGRGYSQGNREDTTNRTMLQDLEAVLQYVKESSDSSRIILVGICSGAKLALHYARNGNHPIAHVIELSSPVLRQEEAESTLATHQAKSILGTYTGKLFRRDTWLKFTNGEIHFQAVWHNITRPMSRLFAKNKKRKTSATTPVNRNKTEGKPFAMFHGQMLLIHGEKDPETKPALSQIHEMLHRNQILSDTYIVKNANHSFYSLIWKNEITEVIEAWLKDKVIK